MISKSTRNVQPSGNLTPRVFPTFPYWKENSQSSNKFHFQYSEVNDFQHIHFFKILVENKHCYAANRKDVGKSSLPFQMRLEPDS